MGKVVVKLHGHLEIMFMVTAEQLQKLVPSLKLEKATELADGLFLAFAEFDINTIDRITMCLAQFAHESSGFYYLRELGGVNYCSKYDFRKDLGNNGKGMGYKYRGGGFIQITGYANYKAAQEHFDLPFVDKPELIEQITIACRVSCWWWYSHGLNRLADEGSEEAFKKITKIINGGYNGLASRMGYWLLAKKIWNKT